MAKVKFHGYNNMPEVKMTPLDKLLMKHRQQVLNKAYKDIKTREDFRKLYENDNYWGITGG